MNWIVNWLMKAKREIPHIKIHEHFHLRTHTKMRSQRLQGKSGIEIEHSVCVGYAVNSRRFVCNSFFGQILGVFLSSSGPGVLILTPNRWKPITEKPVLKTKLTPVAASAKVSNKVKTQKNSTTVTLDDIFSNDSGAGGSDHDADEIQGDASGISVPVSKSLGK